jgi:hypothetical protein
MTATIIEGKAVDSPPGARGTGRPNKILMKDYASHEGWRFRVETDVRLDTNDAELRALLDKPQDAPTGSHAQEKDNAKKMFSAAFGLLP